MMIQILWGKGENQLIMLYMKYFIFSRTSLLLDVFNKKIFMCKLSPMGFFKTALFDIF